MTDYFGGRGHDYKVEDEVVDKRGGLLVVMVSLPDSVREWDQWVGRTKRQDHKGQYALILNEDVAPLKGQPKLIAMAKTSGAVGDFIASVKKSTNETARATLQRFKTTLEKGMAMHALCQDVYRQCPIMDDQSWPILDTHIALRDFLESGADDTKIAGFRKKHNIRPFARRLPCPPPTK